MAVHFTILGKKLDSLSFEEFVAYAKGTHADLFLKCPMVQEKVLKVTQFHVDKSLSAGLAEAGVPIIEFDTQVHIWVKTMEDLMAILSSKEYHDTVLPDAANFMKVEEIKMMVGYDTEFIADGKIL